MAQYIRHPGLVSQDSTTQTPSPSPARVVERMTTSTSTTALGDHLKLPPEDVSTQQLNIQPIAEVKYRGLFRIHVIICYVE